MKLNPQVKKLWVLISAYKNACIADSWKGSKYPEEWPPIDEELKKTKEKLIKELNEIR